MMWEIAGGLLIADFVKLLLLMVFIVVAAFIVSKSGGNDATGF